MAKTASEPFLNRLLGLGSYRRHKRQPIPAGHETPPENAPAVLKEDSVAVAASELRPDLVIELVRAGLPVTSFVILCDAFQLPKDRMAKVVNIAPRTLARRRVFKADESERILRLGRVFQAALELFDGDEAEAREWLLRPQFGLGGAVPLDFAATEPGAKEVENLMGRIQHGAVA